MTTGLTATGLLISSGGVRLVGDLVTVPGAAGTVVFAHGSGSSRLSPRNRHVAERLREGGLSTVLVDLLGRGRGGGGRGDAPPALRRGPPRGRLTDVVAWSRRYAGGGGLGLFGASTGAAAALAVAALHPERVDAVVCRSGRPDLVSELLAEVGAPTLLVVGGADTAVLEINRRHSSSSTARAVCASSPGPRTCSPGPVRSTPWPPPPETGSSLIPGARAIPTKET